MTKLSLGLAFASLLAFASGCTSPVAAPTNENPADETAAPAAATGTPAAISGETGARRVVEMGETTTPNAALTTDLVLDGTTSFEVLDWQFGIEQIATTATSTGGLGAGKAKLHELVVKVRRRAGAASLLQPMGSGTPFPAVILRQNSGLKSQVDIATFTTARVVEMTTEMEGGTVDEYRFAYLTVSVKGGATTVKYDVSKNTASCTGECACVSATRPQLGPFLQSPASPVAPAGTTLIDRALVSVSSEVDIGSASTGMTTSKATLEALEVEGAFDGMAACAFYQAALGVHVQKVEIDSAPALDAKGAPQVTVAWDACTAVARQVTFRGAGHEPASSEIRLEALGLVRTDSPVGASSQVTGWSFARNAPIQTCDRVSQ